MKRVIVEMKASSAMRREMSLAAPTISATEVDLPGFQPDMEFGAVPFDPGSVHTSDDTREMGLQSVMSEASGETVIMRGTIDVDGDKEYEKAKAAISKKKDVVQIWDDGIIETYSGCGCGCKDGEEEVPGQSYGMMDAGLPGMDEVMGDVIAVDEGATFHTSLMGSTAMMTSPCSPTDCQSSVAKGTIGDVARYLNCHRLWAKGIRGQGVAVGIVDTGVDRTAVADVTDGWTPVPSIPWGQHDHWHGTMCATDAKGMAPDIEIYDIGLLKKRASLPVLLSDAIVAFQWAINKYRSIGKPQILSNSWGPYQQSWAPDYATDPNHPFTRKVVEAIDLGMIVTFAAGNCGQVCPDGRCGSDTGPGKSIWGANGHPKVITVGATNIREEWIGYSSQGPAALDPKKPDFVAPSHFQGYRPSDSGTSAANPICAGVIALLRGHDPKLRQDAVKTALQETAKDLCGSGFDTHSGHGMINAERAFNKLFLFRSSLVHASWTHGHSSRVEHPQLLDEDRPFGFYHMYRGKPNTRNWFHFAIPTPVIVNNRRLALDSIMLLFWTDPSVHVHGVHVWDANSILKRYDGLNLTGSHWFERFDVLNNRVRFGIGVSVGVNFGTGDDPKRILFGSCGGDFLS